MPIKVLSDQLASQIAAGEVVERPASVVKELVENAIDAGATTINVDIRGGGRQLVQVADDGYGIEPHEIEIAFMRHATSKLEEVADLTAIETLGFRGEALAAIAAVSQLTVVSRVEAEQAGVRLALEGGQLVNRESVGAPKGTVIAVANLFYNVPARLKFLKSVTTEKRRIDDQVTRYAIAYPDIRFRLAHDGRITFQSSGNGRIRDVLAAVYGPDTARQLIAVGRPEGEDSGEPSAGASEITVAGYVAPGEINRSNRAHITLFANGRWIMDNQLTYAIIQAYHTLLPGGRYPLAVLFIKVPPESVDVNVHPTKSEVRFRQSNLLFSAIQRAVRRALLDDSPMAQTGHFGSLQTAGWGSQTDRPAFSRRDGDSQDHLALSWSSPTGEDDPERQATLDLDSGGETLPIMRLVGQVGASYIITEGPDGIYLIDQHAAHERVLYEQFMAAWEKDGHEKGLVGQGLIEGEVVHLSPSQATLLGDQLELMSRIGFQIEPFGPNSFKVRSVPALLTKLEPARALMDVLEELERDEKPLDKASEARIILRVCKSAAVKAGQNLSQQEMESLINQLERCQNPRTCPHGRPTLIHLSAGQLAREFGRT